MKKIIFALTAATATLSAAMAMNPKNVLTNRLPREAQQLIYSNYPQQTVTRLTTDQNSTLYRVELANGVIVDFDRSGQWNQIDAQDEALPKGMVPRRIARYVKKNFPGQEIVAAVHSQADNAYGIILTNDVELVFDDEGHYMGR